MIIYCSIKTDGSGSVNGKTYKTEILDGFRKENIPISCGYVDYNQFTEDPFSVENSVGYANYLYDTIDGRFCYEVELKDAVINDKVKELAKNESILLGPVGFGSLDENNVIQDDYILKGFDIICRINSYRLLYDGNKLITDLEEMDNEI